jgi:hypothetical protein
LNGELQEQLRGADPSGLAKEVKSVIASAKEAGVYGIHSVSTAALAKFFEAQQEQKTDEELAALAKKYVYFNTIALHRTALHCTALHRAASHCIALHRTASH